MSITIFQEPEYFSPLLLSINGKNIQEMQKAICKHCANKFVEFVIEGGEKHEVCPVCQLISNTK